MAEYSRKQTCHFVAAYGRTQTEANFCHSVAAYGKIQTKAGMFAL